MVEINNAWNDQLSALDQKFANEKPTADQLSRVLDDIQCNLIFPSHVCQSLSRAKVQVGEIMWPNFSETDKAKTASIYSRLEKEISNLNTRQEVEVHDTAISAANEEDYKKIA